MRINNNLMAMNTHRQLGINNSAGAKSIEKLSSGYRINRAGDDAAGLSISEKMRAQIRGLNQASRNSQDSISLIQTAEGALNETQAILQRMRELAVQSSNDTNVSIDRDAIQKEITQLTSEINRIGETTEFNTLKLLDGSVSSTSREQTSTVRTIAVDGTFTANYATATAAVATQTDLNVFSGGTVDLAAGDVLDSAGASANSTIQITKASSNTFTIEVDVADSANGTVFSSTETLSFTAGSDFVYSNHGIDFTIAAADLAKFTAVNSGVSITFGSADVGTSVATSNDWTGNGTSGQLTISTGVTVDVANNTELEAARSIEVSAADSATITIEVKDSAGATFMTDTYTMTAAGATVAYDANGISFSMTSNLSAGGTASITFNLDTTNTNASSVVEDNSLVFQVGANESQTMGLSLGDMRAAALGISSTSAGVDGEAGFVATAEVTDGTSSTASEFGLDVTTSAAAQAAITTINDALESVSSERAKLGAVQNRLEHTIKNLDTSSENLQASESRIRDVDMAKEMMEFTKNNILQQAAQSMLAQANQAPQGVLQLLR